MRHTLRKVIITLQLNNKIQKRGAVIIKLYRRRLIPDETVFLKDDEVVFQSDSMIVTKWRALKPRLDFTHGCSCYFLDEGFKVSRMFREDGSPLYYYCDIIETERAGDEYIFTDLLFDVIVYEDGFVKVLDIDEGAKALEESVITSGQLCRGLSSLQRLLDIIYGGNFGCLTKHMQMIK